MVEQLHSVLAPVRSDSTTMAAGFQDLRYGVRQLRKSPSFALTATLTLALGIGANAAIFSVVQAVLLRPLPFRDPGRLFVAATDSGVAASAAGAASGPDFIDYRDRNRTFQQLSAIVPQFTYTFDSEQGPVLVNCTAISPEFFPALGLKPLLGRLYEPAEYHIDGVTAVISYRFWQRQFGGDPHILGRTIHADEVPMTIIGVMPPLTELFPNTDIWAKLVPDFDFMKWRSNKFLTIIGRLKPGVTPRQAEQDLSSILRRAPGVSPRASVTLIPLKEYFVGNVETPLRLLMSAVALILIIACVNLANLLLARANSRQQEIAIRQGLGATRNRMLQQFLTENWLLAALGGALGLEVASLVLSLLAKLNATDLPRGSTIAIDLPVLMFAAGISLLALFIFGWVPVLTLKSIDLNQTLRTGRSEAGRVGKRGLRALVVSEIAASVVLVLGAGLLLRSFWQVTHVDPGFEPQHLLTAYLRRNASGREQQVFIREMLERLAAIPGVDRVSVADCIPGGSAPSAQLAFADRLADPNHIPASRGCFISPGFFETIGAPLLAGRSFTDFDTPESTPVVIVNKLFAERFWHGENPLGKRVAVGYTGPGRRALGSTRFRQVIGVIANVKHQSLDAPAEPALYMPYVQDETRHVLVSLNLFVRARNPAFLAEPVRSEIRRLNPNQPVARMQTMSDYLVRSLAARRFNLLLFGAFAALAFLLAIVGIYSVIAYSVSRRTREFGVRIALGAAKRDVLESVLKEGLAHGAAGLVIGLAAAPAALYAMRSLVFGISPLDPLTYVAVAILFVVVTATASAIPARRASSIDPIRAIGSE